MATLATLRLLSTLGCPPPPPALRCICYGMPPLGDAALAALVDTRGWGPYFRSYALPEDPVPRLLLGSTSTHRSTSVDDAPRKKAPTGGSASAAAAAASEAALVDALLAAEAEESNEPSNIQTSSKESRVVDPVPRPSWASVTMKAVARTAGAVWLPGIPLPTFHHFGDPLLLTGVGVASGASGRKPGTQAQSQAEEVAAAAAVVDAAVGAGSGAQQQLLRLGRFHRMPTYRARVLGIVAGVVRDSRQSQAERPVQDLPSGSSQSKEEGGEAEVTAAVLLPDPRPLAADARLPVLWPASMHYKDALVSKGFVDDSTGALPDMGGAGSQPQPSPGLWRWSKSEATNSSSRDASSRPGSARLPGTCSVHVSVRGHALDVCTAAVLHFPGNWVVPGQIAVNGPRQQVVSEVAALETAQTSTGQHWSGAMLGSLRDRIFHRQRESQAALPSPSTASSASDVLLLHFAVPTAAVLKLQVGGGGTLPSPTLVLFSDFGKGTAPVTLHPRTAWLVGVDAPLAKSALAQLQRSATADAEAAAEQKTSLTWLGLPKRLQRTQHGLRNGVNDGPASSESVPTPSESSGEARPAKPVLGRSAGGRAAVRGVWRRVRDTVTGASAAAVAAAGTRAHPPPAVLLRGVAILDTSFALEGIDPAAQQLALAADLLWWKAEQAAVANGLFDLSSAVDEGPAAHAELHVTGRIWQRLQQATLGVRRRAALLRRWQAFRTLPAPDVVVVVLDGSTLHAKPAVLAADGTPALDVDTLDAVHAVARTAAACGAATLLAVDSPDVRDAAHRRRLSFSSGLHGRPGAVVPLLHGNGEERLEGEVATKFLEAAIVAHAAVKDREVGAKARSGKEEGFVAAAGDVFRARL